MVDDSVHTHASAGACRTWHRCLPPPPPHSPPSFPAHPHTGSACPVPFTVAWLAVRVVARLDVSLHARSPTRRCCCTTAQTHTFVHLFLCSDSLHPRTRVAAVGRWLHNGSMG